MTQPPHAHDPAADLAISWSDASCRITLQRVAKRNALATAHWQLLERALLTAAAEGIRVLVLAGQPDCFSAGADLDELADLLRDPGAMAANVAQVQRTQQLLADLPLVTIAAIDGLCVGGGLGLALACDFRIASSRSWFALSPARLGLVYSPADTARLAAACGMQRARDLLLSARRMDADEALACGLIGQLVAPAGLGQATDALSARVRDSSPASIAGIKRVLAHLTDPDTVSRAEAELAFRQAFDGADFAEGARAFLQRRTPRFGGQR